MSNILSTFSFLINSCFWRFILHCKVRIYKGAIYHFGKNVRMRRAKLSVSKGGKLFIDDHCTISNVSIYVGDGATFHLSKYSILSCKTIQGEIIVDDGSCSIGHHSKLSCKKIWIRFNGCLTIGNFTNINDGSEIRCDERIRIGDYNQISYNTRIWDTNTHNFYNVEKRRKLTEDYYPYYGYEQEKPITKSVFIGNDCWISENCVIMKGSTIGDWVMLGYHTMVFGKNIESNRKVVSKVELMYL